MKALPKVQYAFIWPMWIRESWDPISLDLSDTIQDDRIVFWLRKDGYFQGSEWIWNAKQYYTCTSCAEANESWDSSEFRPLESGEIPLHIEEEIKEHVSNHVKFGTWGVSKWRARQKEKK